MLHTGNICIWFAPNSLNPTEKTNDEDYRVVLQYVDTRPAWFVWHKATYKYMVNTSILPVNVYAYHSEYVQTDDVYVHMYIHSYIGIIIIVKWEQQAYSIGI